MCRLRLRESERSSGFPSGKSQRRRYQCRSSKVSANLIRAVCPPARVHRPFRSTFQVGSPLYVCMYMYVYNLTRLSPACQSFIQRPVDQSINRSIDLPNHRTRLPPHDRQQSKTGGVYRDADERLSHRNWQLTFSPLLTYAHERPKERSNGQHAAGALVLLQSPGHVRDFL